MSNIISSHNNKIIKSNDKPRLEKSCNCRIKDTCPLSNKCLSKNIIYKATVKDSNANYIGMTTTEFKARLANHTYSFKNENKKNATSLAQYIWDNKLNPKPNIKWEILKQCRPYVPGQTSCDVCTSEKIEIIAHTKDSKNINKKTDIGTKCPHRKKFLLGPII